MFSDVKPRGNANGKAQSGRALGSVRNGFVSGISQRILSGPQPHCRLYRGAGWHSFIYRGASFLSIAEAFYLCWQSREDAFYKTRRPRAPSVRGAAFLRAAQSAKTAPCTRCVDARSHRFWLAALMPDIRKKPGKPSDLLNFFAHTSSKAARPKPHSTLETAIFDAKQGNFPQIPFVPVKKI